VHASNPSTWEAENGGYGVQGHPGLHSEFEGSLGYIKRSYLKKKKSSLCSSQPAAPGMKVFFASAVRLL
jgi:hypothetical protein